MRFRFLSIGISERKVKIIRGTQNYSKLHSAVDPYFSDDKKEF